ncbi:protein translocase subunit SecD [Nocardioides terrisoli]|uniref:protein translocase subunit SecD n=1 Tax=Nocardioides terrisoli TaxID=3388267 RepID=UPI00287BB8C4|nr:protein translocase subunit SecD [Nocardioides marmorisolisilvae]
MSVAKQAPRAGRTLMIFIVVVGVLYGLAALGGTWQPRLGLDLEGGTRITLIAEGSPAAAKLKQASDIIDQRVNGSGVTEAQVSTQGSTNIVVEIPGKSRQDLVDSVKRTAQMRFRVVAYCTQLTGSFCEASGLPQKPSATPSPGASPSANPSSSPSANPSSNPSAAPSSSPTSSSSPSTNSQGVTATPKPRPAPAYEVKATTPKDKHKPKKKKQQQKTAATTTAPTSSAKPDPGAKVSDYLAWSKDPGTAWQLIFAVSQCDPKSHQALVPPIANTMDVTNPPTQAALEKKLNKVKRADLVHAVDEPGRPLVACRSDGTKALLSVAAINGPELKSASSGVDPQSLGSYIVQLSFKSSGRDTFAKLSRAMWSGATGPYAGGRFAIVLDGELLSDPGFDGVIANGNAQISGGFTEASAQSLANSLKFGALPVKFKKDVSTQTIGPSLAGDQLSAGLLAGAIGLLIVMFYCLLYYRGLGTVVIASLVIAALITYAVVLVLAKTAGFALTLPGIAGLIVAVGITADSFIVYFERIRDEMRAGKSMRVAVQAGWKRARNTCLAADTVSFLAALVLYIFAIGVVRGFAFALGISTVIDVAVFFWFTHPMMTLLSARKFFSSGSRFSGLSKETLGIDHEPGVVGGRL